MAWGGRYDAWSLFCSFHVSAATSRRGEDAVGDGVVGDDGFAGDRGRSSLSQSLPSSHSCCHVRAARAALHEVVNHWCWFQSAYWAMWGAGYWSGGVGASCSLMASRRLKSAAT